MADNMYVLNPVFKADTFQETVAPLLMYAQAYKEQEAKIEDMTDKAAALEWIANQDPNSRTAALYKDMSDKIKGIRDDLINNGLMGGLRSRILGMRRTYSANSAEIARRYEDMQKYQQRMEQLYDKDNSIVFSPESQNVSIDDFAGGRRPQIKAISGNEIMARGAAVGKRLTSLVFGDGVLGQIMGGQFWKYYQENGMTDKALEEALSLAGHSDKFSMFKQVMDGVYNSFKDFDPISQQHLKDRFIEGVYSGAVYNKQVSPQQNLNFESDAARDARLFNKQMAQNQDRRAQEQHDAQMVAAGWLPNGKGGFTPGPNATRYGGMSGSRSSSGGSSGSNGGGGSRVPQTSARYMTGNGTSMRIATVTNGKPVDEKGKPVDEGMPITFDYNPQTGLVEAYCRNKRIATYDMDSNNKDKLGTIAESDKSSIHEVLGIKHNAMKKTDMGYKWDKHDAVLLNELFDTAIQTVAASGGDWRVLNNYEAKFNSDANAWRNNNGSIYFGPKNIVMPTVNDVYGGYEGYEEINPDIN